MSTHVQQLLTTAVCVRHVARTLSNQRWHRVSGPLALGLQHASNPFTNSRHVGDGEAISDRQPNARGQPCSTATPAAFVDRLLYITPRSTVAATAAIRWAETPIGCHMHPNHRTAGLKRRFLTANEGFAASSKYPAGREGMTAGMVQCSDEKPSSAIL